MFRDSVRNKKPRDRWRANAQGKLNSHSKFTTEMDLEASLN
jgi:hypothetical protein